MQKHASQLLIFLAVLLLSLQTLLHAPVLQAEPSQLELSWCLDHYPGRHEFNGQEVSGPAVDFMNAMAKQANITLIHSSDTPFPRCLKMLENGQQDLMVALNITPDREKYLHMIPLYSGFSEKLYYSTETGKDAKELSQLDKKIIATVRGYAFNIEDITYLKQNTSLVEVKSIEDSLAMLTLNHVDYVLAPRFSTQAIISQHPRYSENLKEASIVFTADNSKYVHLAISKNGNVSQQLIKLITDTVEQMRDSGELEKLLFP